MTLVKPPTGVWILSRLYLLGAIALVVVLVLSRFINIAVYPKIAPSNGISFVPEWIAEIALAVLFIIFSYGLLKLKKWIFWLIVSYSVFIIIFNIIQFISNREVFYGNVYWSIFTTIYILTKYKYFSGKAIKDVGEDEGSLESVKSQ